MLKNYIQYFKFLLNQERFNEILSRRTIVFIHIYKVGGSSFWHSLAKELSNSIETDYAISDSHEESKNLLKFAHEGTDNQALLMIKERFLKSNKKRHVFHHHKITGFIHEIIPSAGFLVMLRKPEDRLRSAFRHFRQATINKTIDQNTNQAINYNFEKNPLEFFKKDILIYGLNHYFANLFNYHLDPLARPPAFVIDFIKKNFYFFTLDDFKSNNYKIKYIEKRLSISTINNLHYQGTKTDSIFDKDLDSLLSTNKDFSRKWNEFLNAEILWHKALGLDI